MRLGLICERKLDFIIETNDPGDIQSELVSEAEADELQSGLRDAGHEIVRIRDVADLVNRIGHWRRACDLVFNRSTGYRGNERNLVAPAVLEAAGILYLGCSPYVHGLVRNKYHTKLVIHAAGVATPPAAVIRAGEAPNLGGVAFPAIVKPLCESSSLGIETGKSVVTDEAQAIARAQDLISRYRQPAIVETFVRGIEIEVPIVADPQVRALGAVAITLLGRVISGDEYLATDTVYDDGYGFAPPPTSIDVPRVLRAAEETARALGLRDYGRVDFRVAEDGTPWVMEANTLPHVQRHSSFFALAKERGLKYHEMLGELVEIAAARAGTRSRAHPT